MIKSLSIRNIATFNNDGININNLKQINIIYGANGSGKSTIGKAIANIESYDQSSISWENDRPMEVLAYNKEFCKNNFLEQMPGVFTLGEASCYQGWNYSTIHGLHAAGPILRQTASSLLWTKNRLLQRRLYEQSSENQETGT